MTRHPYRPRLCECGYETIVGPWCYQCAQEKDPGHLSIIEWDAED